MPSAFGIDVKSPREGDVYDLGEEIPIEFSVNGPVPFVCTGMDVIVCTVPPVTNGSASASNPEYDDNTTRWSKNVSDPIFRNRFYDLDTHLTLESSDILDRLGASQSRTLPQFHAILVQCHNDRQYEGYSGVFTLRPPPTSAPSRSPTEYPTITAPSGSPTFAPTFEAYYIVAFEIGIVVVQNDNSPFEDSLPEYRHAFRQAIASESSDLIDLDDIVNVTIQPFTPDLTAQTARLSTALPPSHLETRARRANGQGASTRPDLKASSADSLFTVSLAVSTTFKDSEVRASTGLIDTHATNHVSAVVDQLRQSMDAGDLQTSLLSELTESALGNITVATQETGASLSEVTETIEVSRVSFVRPTFVPSPAPSWTMHPSHSRDVTNVETEETEENLLRKSLVALILTGTVVFCSLFSILYSVCRSSAVVKWGLSKLTRSKRRT